jgi:cation:H+ antiporter
VDQGESLGSISVHDDVVTSVAAWTALNVDGVAGLVVGAHYFVTALEALARQSGWSGFLLSVILTPVATELPEVLNSVIWIRRGADTLAFGNVTGAMAFQASLVPALGMWLMPWRFNPLEGAVGVLALAAALFVYVSVRRRGVSPRDLVGAGAFYFLFVGVALAGVR